MTYLTSEFTHEQWKYVCTKDFCLRVHSSIIHNSAKQDTTKVITGKWRKKQYLSIFSQACLWATWKGRAKILYFCLYILRKNKLEGKMKAIADSHILSIQPTLLQSSYDFAILQLQKQLNEVIQLKSRKSGFYLS